MKPAIRIIGYSAEDLGIYNKPIKRKIDYGNCCYCNVKLTFNHHKDPTHKTKEHIIPKHKGGHTTKPCCTECNAEKGGLLLTDYIKFLTGLLYYTSDEAAIKKLETKIRNATKIAMLLFGRDKI